MAMTGPEQYRRGLKKLGLWQAGQICDWYHCLIPHEFAGRMHEDHEIPAIDLRHDPAFAWRALEALIKLAETDGTAADEADLWFSDAHKGCEDALYAAICKLGEEGEP